MINVNLTTFLDIATKAGAQKLTALRGLKNRGDYNPAHDFWRPLRLAIVKAHQERDVGAFDRLILKITDKKKLSNYPDRIRAYKKWWGPNEYAWFEPADSAWVHGRVSVRVNPELGLELHEERIAVKLYFKSDPLTKLRADVILHLLATTVVPQGPNSDVGILDVPRGKLIHPTVEKPWLEAALKGEAGYIAAAWDSM